MRTTWTAGEGVGEGKIAWYPIYPSTLTGYFNSFSDTMTGEVLEKPRPASAF